ncbi:CheW protein [Halothece sp. PCC 7418]|uniref:chemotaxis protein CheW n=1 Tax=Halothece sp. (strain PCC 7418) TaxID=65093 RepID=UPI0002A089D8|nr:chemotaxis protein CheW [Halothece sp. PCC 7418]AFZ45457.1 CheW protein [Halothece sp. PCC 7418]
MKNTSTTERLQELLPKLFSSDRAEGERYLLFRMTSDLQVAISLDQVWEATTLSATAITPIPQMPPWILGWTNGRDRVFCLIALAEFLGLEQVKKIPQYYPIIIVQLPSQKGNFQQRLLGLSVHRIVRTLRIQQEEIVSPVGEFPQVLTPYLQGYFQSEQEPIAILNLEAIAHQIQQQIQFKS